MKIIPQLRKNMKQMIKQEYYIAITFILFPLIVGLIFGVMFKESFEGKSTLDPVRISVDYDESHFVGKILKADFEKESIQSFIKIDEENPECQVIMQDDFKGAEVINLNTTNARADIVKTFFENVVGNVTAHEEMESVIMNEAVDEEKKYEIIEKISTQLGAIQEIEGVKTQVVEGYKTLSSYEYYALSIFSFTSMLLVVWFINKYIDEAEEGIIKRSLAAAYHKVDYLMGYLLSMFAIALMINISYILIIKVMGIGFKENIGAVAVIALGQSLLQAALALVVVSFTKNKMVASSAVSILLLIPAIVGGTFTNSDSVEGSIGKLMAKVAPNSLIINSYKSLAISGSLKNGYYELGAILGLSLLFIVISITVSTLKEEA